MSANVCTGILGFEGFTLMETWASALVGTRKKRKEMNIEQGILDIECRRMLERRGCGLYCLNWD